MSRGKMYKFGFFAFWLDGATSEMGFFYGKIPYGEGISGKMIPMRHRLFKTD
jgi:hypothetical protein